MLSILIVLASMACSVENAETWLEVKEHSSGQASASQLHPCSLIRATAKPSGNPAPPPRPGPLSHCCSDTRSLGRSVQMNAAREMWPGLLQVVEEGRKDRRSHESRGSLK